ncbi:MAG: glutathione S-transferase [Gammaproteobacteria bacterium HGW-Gammaproteobacteria-2]|jgi:glutathione S-transferase|nr:MAG: glutathione S-transferase [Gammaproteobacteria bacterium HGW-Gammaproteobacteria-2]
MYTLYYAPGAASFVVHWLLIEAGAEYQLQRVNLQAGEQRSEAYLKLNPNGVVPTLLIDGKPASEAAALLLHLADSFPAMGLAPAVGSLDRAHYYQWVLHLANTVQPAFRHWFFAAEAAGEANAEAAKAQARARIEAAWQRIDDHLNANGPYLLGESPSAADFLLTMLMRWSRNMPRPATEWVNLAALAQRMKARPSFAQLCQAEELTEWV